MSTMVIIIIQMEIIKLKTFWRKKKFGYNEA